MNLSIWISIFALIVSIFAYFQARQANKQYAAVEKLNIDAEIIYHSNLCLDSECSPSLTIKNIGKIPVTQLKIFLNPALVPTDRKLLIKYTFTDWNQTIPILEPGESATLNFPKDFLVQMIAEGKKISVNFKNGAPYNTSSITNDRILLQIQTKYARQSDLKEYSDKLYYIQNSDGKKWVSIDQATSTPSYKDMISALKISEKLDFTKYENIVGTDKIYSHTESEN